MPSKKSLTLDDPLAGQTVTLLITVTTTGQPRDTRPGHRLPRVCGQETAAGRTGAALPRPLPQRAGRWPHLPRPGTPFPPCTP